MSSNPVVPTAPVEAPDPFKGQPTSHQEFSDWRRTGELPERFKEAEKPEPPAAEKSAETEAGKEPVETEQEKQDRERDEKGKFAKKVEFSPEQQKAFDRAFAKREAKLRAEFETRFAAKTSETPQATPPAKEAAAAPDTNEPLPPELPNLNTWTGTIAEYDAAVKQYPAKLKAYFDAQRQMEAERTSIQTRLTQNEQATLKAHPDYKETFDELVTDIQAGSEVPLPPHVLRAIGEESEDPHGLTYHLAKNREDYQRLASITNPVQALREVLKLDAKLQASTSATPVPAEKPAKPDKPKPPEPVGARASASAFDVNDEKLDPDTWAKLRNEQEAKARGR